MRRRARTYTNISTIVGEDSGEETARPLSRTVSPVTSRTVSPVTSRTVSPSTSRQNLRNLLRTRTRQSSVSSLTPSRNWPLVAPPDCNDSDDDGLYFAIRAPALPLNAPPPPPFSSLPVPPSDESELDDHRPISTRAPMTETDDDGRPARLPTARARQSGGWGAYGNPYPGNGWAYSAGGRALLRNPLAAVWGPSPSPLDVLFGAGRFLSVVPAVCGMAAITFRAAHIHPLDTFPAILFTLLTAYQCLALTSGLLFRWRTYYPPLPTLIRLLALQVICWSATQITLETWPAPAPSGVRDVAVWAFIATCTSLSRAVQMWVTSNLWRHATTTAPSKLGNRKEPRWRGGTWRGRRWDWGVVTRRCVVPLGISYFIMAWAAVVVRTT